MFERLSKSAKAAVNAACIEAATRGDAVAEDVHLLIGCSMGRSEASTILHDVGATRQRILELLDGADSQPFDDDDAHALSTVGIDLAEVMRAAEDVFGSGALAESRPSARRGPTRRAAPLGPSAKQAIVQALSETINRGDRRIEAGHLLLGVLHDPSPRCRAITFLLDLDYDAAAARLNEPLAG